MLATRTSSLPPVGGTAYMSVEYVARHVQMPTISSSDAITRSTVNYTSFLRSRKLVMWATSPALPGMDWVWFHHVVGRQFVDHLELAFGDHFRRAMSR